MIRLIAAAVVLAAAVVIAVLLPALLRPGAAVTGVGPATEAGQVLTGLVQVTVAAAALVLLAAALRYRRFRVLATVAGGFAAAAALVVTVFCWACLDLVVDHAQRPAPGGGAASRTRLSRSCSSPTRSSPSPTAEASTAHVDVTGARGEAIRQGGGRYQLVTVTGITLFG